MGKRFRTIKEKLGIPSGRAIIHVVVVEIIINLVWNEISKMFTIPLVREIGFLVVFVAGLYAVAWYLPKLAPVFTGRKTVSTARPRLEHDGVLWEETQTWNSYYAKGPLCPKDYTPLAIRHGNRMDTEIQDGFLIQKNGSTQLICPECSVIYTLGDDKRIGESRSEATSRFEGMRRRNNYE